MSRAIRELHRTAEKRMVSKNHATGKATRGSIASAAAGVAPVKQNSQRQMAANATAAAITGKTALELVRNNKASAGSVAGAVVGAMGKKETPRRRISGRTR